MICWNGSFGLTQYSLGFIVQSSLLSRDETSPLPLYSLRSQPNWLRCARKQIAVEPPITSCLEIGNSTHIQRRAVGVKSQVSLFDPRIKNRETKEEKLRKNEKKKRRRKKGGIRERERERKKEKGSIIKETFEKKNELTHHHTPTSARRSRYSSSNRT